MFHFLHKLSRKNKQALMIMFDSIAVLSSIFAAFSIRLGYLYHPVTDLKLLLIMYASPLLAIPLFYRFGLYHTVVRYVSFKGIWHINQAVILYAILWGFVAFMTVNWEAFPRSVILINWILILTFIITSRLFVRWLLLELPKIATELKSKNVLIYGAGSAGRQLSHALNESNDYKVVAFIDDSMELHKNSVNGLKVFSSDDLLNLIEKKNIQEVLLAMPSLDRTRRKEIISSLELAPVIVKSMPSISELAQGKIKVNDFLEVNIGDLLGRESVSPNNNLLKINITNKTVLVTGAGGSIGSELCRQVLLLKPKSLILYELSESALYHIEQELIGLNNFKIDVFPVIGSVLDKLRFENICNYYNIQTIYHAAAYKHVPLVEYNQSQGVLNNTIGTLFAAEAAIVSKVETFVLISTDKAVRPTNIMGASKRAAELVLQAFAELSSNTCFTMVRFGNVLDSSGSVIPLFRKQIKKGGPITVTHKDIVRYFMTIPEAVELVIQSGAMAKGGEVFVLDMGKPVRIYDLAVKMIKLSGLTVLDENNPKGDIEIQFTGLRPGEKLFEELLVGGRSTVTENKLIMRAEEKMISWSELEPMLMEIRDALSYSETVRIYELLQKLIPEFEPSHKI
jgi:FlaA1/EpsC-like NDP-sugar epimerase